MRPFIDGLRLFSLPASLGGVASLVAEVALLNSETVEMSVLMRLAARQITQLVKRLRLVYAAYTRHLPSQPFGLDLSTGAKALAHAEGELALTPSNEALHALGTAESAY